MSILYVRVFDKTLVHIVKSFLWIEWDLAMTNSVLLVQFRLITAMLIIMLHANLFVILYFHDFNVVDLL